MDLSILFLGKVLLDRKAICYHNALIVIVKGGDYLGSHKKIERVREIERRRHRREKRKKLAAKGLKGSAPASSA